MFIEKLRLVYLVKLNSDHFLCISSLYTGNMIYDGRAGTDAITLNTLQNDDGCSFLRSAPSSDATTEYAAASQVEFMFQCFFYLIISLNPCRQPL